MYNTPRKSAAVKKTLKDLTPLVQAVWDAHDIEDKRQQAIALVRESSGTKQTRVLAIHKLYGMDSGAEMDRFVMNYNFRGMKLGV